MLQEKMQNSLERKDPIQSDDGQMNSSHLYV